MRQHIRPLRSIVAAALLTGAMAGEADHPPVQVAIGDGADLITDWKASIYNKLWNEPELAPARAKVDEALAKAQQELGFDPLAALAAMSGFRFQFDGLSPDPAGQGIHIPQPHFRLQCDLGPFAQQLLRTIAKHDIAKTAQVPGADEAFGGGDEPLVARFGTTLVMTMGYPKTAVQPAGMRPSGAVECQIELQSLLASLGHAMQGREREQFERMASLYKELGFNRMTYRAALVPEGIHERVTMVGAPTYGSRPVDRTVIGRLPKETLLAVAIGIDGKTYWERGLKPALQLMVDQQIAEGRDMSMDKLMEESAKGLASIGVSASLDELVTGIDGTLLLAVTPTSTLPGVTIALPRSPQIDQLVVAGLQAIKQEAPAEGAALIFMIPRLPVMLHITRDAGHWLLTSDQAMIERWQQATPGGVADTPAARLALGRAGADAYLIGFSDTRALLKLGQQYVTAIPLPDAEIKRQICDVVGRYATEVATGFCIGTSKPTESSFEARGLLGMTMMPAILAAVAIPNLLESRVTANEMATAATLKSGIFPAEIQFQAGGYLDQDGDNVGEYGFLSELSGRAPVGNQEAGALKLLQGPLATSDTVSGYRYAIFLPDGKGGALAEPADNAKREPLPADVKDANEQERRFVVYAWPVDGDSGRRTFALTADGMVRVCPDIAPGQTPEWNAVLGGQGWDAEPAWPVLQR